MGRDSIHAVHILEGFSGGIATHICTVLPELVRQGFDVTLICSTARGCPDARERLDRLRLQGVNAHIVPMYREISIIRDIGSFIAILKILFALRPHVVHTHASKAGALGRIAATVLRIPVRLHSPHCFAFLRCRSRWSAWVYLILERLLGKLTTKLVAVGRAEADIAANSGIVCAEHCVTIGNGIAEGPTIRSVYDSEKKYAIRRSLNIPRDARIVTAVCRLVNYKGVFRFLRAAQLSSVEDTVFLIAGDGELRPSIETYVREHHLTDKVRLVGYISNMDSIYAISNLLVLCSDAEACPYVLVEAMRARCTIVATSVIGIKELVLNNETGILVEGNSNAVAVAIDELLVDESRRKTIAEKAYQYFKSHHLLDRQITDISRLYKTCA